MSPLCEILMSRASDKRRALAVERALRFFDEATCWFGLSRSYRQICRDRIRKAPRPTAAAKSQVRDLAQVQGRRKHSKPGTCPDFSWATEARAEMWRRHGRRWNPPPHDDLLRQLERRLLQGAISQQAFDERCCAVIEKPLPTWMINLHQRQMTSWRFPLLEVFSSVPVIEPLVGRDSPLLPGVSITAMEPDVGAFCGGFRDWRRARRGYTTKCFTKKII